MRTRLLLTLSALLALLNQGAFAQAPNIADQTDTLQKTISTENTAYCDPKTPGPDKHKALVQLPTDLNDFKTKATDFSNTLDTTKDYTAKDRDAKKAALKKLTDWIDSNTDFCTNSPFLTAPAAPPDAAKPTTDQASSIATIQQLVATRDSIKKALDAEDPDFSLVLGIGSLVTGPGVTDYSSSSNVIHTSNLGRATPQLLTGLALRTHIPNFSNFGDTDGCTPVGETLSKPRFCDVWRNRPWSGFISVKFAPGSSQTVNGFVFGGTYAMAKYLNAFIGFALTPVNEASPGFRGAAAQFVKSEQAAGRLLNFDPNALLNNTQNAFDGLPLTDSTGKIYYQGNPLTVHYRGGAVFGVSIPIYFKTVF